MSDLRRRAMLAGKSGTDLPVMDPAITGYTEGYKLNRMKAKPYLEEMAEFAVTDFIYVGATGTFYWFAPLTTKETDNPSTHEVGHFLQFKEIGGNYTDWWNNKIDGASHSVGLSAIKRYVRFAFDPDQMADMYAYNSSTGEVYYAGINTPYYGKTNIND